MRLKSPTPPRSPFSAPFSRSARETKLRIRNLFQWKKKRPPLFALALFCVIALCSGSLVSCVQGPHQTQVPAPEETATVSPADTATPQPSTGPESTQSHAPDLTPFFQWNYSSMKDMLQSGARFNGNRSSNPRELDMEYSILNGRFTHTLKLYAGDVLNVNLKVEEGTLGILIQQEDQTTIYQNEDLKTSQFALEISESGDYQVTITGLDTKGSLLIKA